MTKDEAPVARSPFRRDIQALRALAVTLVVVQHFWPTRLHGGYVGVDIFFVISGFLITSHLSRDLEAEGRVRLGTFYARRVRRLLPAAFAVLVAGSVLVWAFLPFSAWERTAREVIASAFYVENWALAASAVDYSASQDDATIAQHYWSLSVEEQFYLIWPLLLWGCVALWRFLETRRRGGAPTQDPLMARRSTTFGIAGALVLVIAVSYPVSVWWVENSSQAAYFVTPGRLWEFAVGAAVALLPRVLGPRVSTAPAQRVAQLILTLAGWAGLVIASVTYSSSTPFPGQAALLPVLSTAAIIAAGCMGPLPTTLEKVYGLRPVQWMGDISYSVYLWHWPLVVVAPYLLGLENPELRNLGLYGVTLLVAHVSYRWIEPLGQKVKPAAAPWKTLVAMAAGMALIAGMGGIQMRSATVKAEEAASLQSALSAGGCTGPNALLRGDACSNVTCRSLSR